MAKAKYSMSFSTGGLYHQKSVKVARLYFESKDWVKVRETIMQKNILQTRTLASAKRISREICSRLKLLTDQELRVLIEGPFKDQAYILWLAVCRRYRFIYEFAVEVLREKFLTFQHELNYEDYDAFFNTKASWNEKLDRISDSTQKKLRQVLFKILREAGLLTRENSIIPAILSSDVIKAVENRSRKDFSVFPVAESDLKEWAK